MRKPERLPLLLLALVSVPVFAYLAWDLSLSGQLRCRQPWALLLLAAAPLVYWLLVLRRTRNVPALQYSGAALVSRLRPGLITRLVSLPATLRIVALALLACALARPQTHDRGGFVEVQGIDIVVALDMSNSMEAGDLAPNRLEAAKRVVDDFVSRRRSDRIGIVVFGKEAYTHSPLTLDYSMLRTMLGDLQLGLIDGSATAIGNAVGVALARLRKSDAKSRVVILLTDGDNNSGNVTPKQAARYAAAMGVKVFTILMGPQEGRAVVGRDIFGRPLRLNRQYPVNPKLLEEIASETGGKAYRATDRQALERNFGQILDELDKNTRRDVAMVYTDAFRPFVAFAVGLLLLEALLALTRFRQFP